MTPPSRVATPNSIPLAAKRYDRASGTAVFTGCIPLKPGQLFDTDLANVTLWDGVTEIGITVSALWPRHPDGSLKVIRVSATLNLAAATQHNYTLRLGTARTQSGPTEPAITGAWMKTPRLIGCTDAAHLCASRVATLPLVPIPHPNLPASWNKFLTEEWDHPTTPYASWGRFKARVMSDDPDKAGFWGAANYNFLNAMYCKYLTSGDLDRLNEAHHLVQHGTFPQSVEACTYGRDLVRAEHVGHLNRVVFYGEPYDGHAVGDPFDANPDGWPDRSGGPVSGSEWNSGVDTDFLMCYMLSGWGQVLGTFLCRALSMFGRGAFPDTPKQNLNPPPGTNQPILNYGGRFQWRLMRGADILYAILSPPMALQFDYRYGAGKVIPSLRTADGKAKFKTWAQREHLDFYDWYSGQYVAGHWLKGSWWSRPGWFAPSGTVPQGLPFFQLGCLWYDAMLYYHHVDPDPRVPAFIARAGEMLRQCVRGPEGAPKMAGSGFKLPYNMPNSYTNSATNGPVVAGSGDGFWGNTILLPLYATAYALTGDPWYRDLLDLHASNTRMAVADGGRAGFSTFKELGECYSFAFHAAAYRAGVKLGEWELGGAHGLRVPQDAHARQPRYDVAKKLESLAG